MCASTGLVDATALGIAYLPEDRKDAGLTLNMDIVDNTTLVSLRRYSRVLLDRERAETCDPGTRAAVAASRSALADAVSTLSGGNQQKVLLAKWLEVSPKVLILDEPTRGVDIGAKEEIYQLLQELAAEGHGLRHDLIGNERTARHVSSHRSHASWTACDDSRWTTRDGRTDHSCRRIGNRWRMKHTTTWPVWIVPAAALLVLVAFTIVYEFATRGESILIKPENLLNILRQVSFVGIIAMGMTLVITLGGIDLSVGSLVAFLGGIGILFFNRLLAGNQRDSCGACRLRLDRCRRSGCRHDQRSADLQGKARALHRNTRRARGLPVAFDGTRGRRGVSSRRRGTVRRARSGWYRHSRNKHRAQRTVSRSPADSLARV